MKHNSACYTLHKNIQGINVYVNDYKREFFQTPVAFRGESPDSEKLAKVQEALGFLEGFVKGKQFAAGDKVTVADLSFVASVSSMEAAGK